MPETITIQVGTTTVGTVLLDTPTTLNVDVSAMVGSKGDKGDTGDPGANFIFSSTAPTSPAIGDIWVKI